MNQGLVMRYAEIHLVCQRLRCSVRVGDLPFGLFDWEPVRTATGFVIHISPLPSAEDLDSDMHSLMQAVTWNNCDLEQLSFSSTTEMWDPHPLWKR